MKKKNKIALVIGKFLNKFEMQAFEPLTKSFQMVGFGSLKPMHRNFQFPVVHLASPVDLPAFPYKMQILNRIFVDAQYLFGLGKHLEGFDIAHSAETYFHYTKQCLDAKKKGYVKKVLEDEKQVRGAYDRLYDQKLIDLFKNTFTIEKKEVSYDEFFKAEKSK